MIVVAQYEDQEAKYTIPLKTLLKYLDIEITIEQVEEAAKKAIINT